MSAKMDRIKADIAEPSTWVVGPLTRGEAEWLVSEVDRLTWELAERTRELADERSAHEACFESLRGHSDQLAEAHRERDQAQRQTVAYRIEGTHGARPPTVAELRAGALELGWPHLYPEEGQP